MLDWWLWLFPPCEGAEGRFDESEVGSNTTTKRPRSVRGIVYAYVQVSVKKSTSTKSSHCWSEISHNSTLSASTTVRFFYDHHHQFLSCEGPWGTTDDFATSFLSIFPVLHCPLGLRELQACPFPVVVAFSSL